MVLIGNRDQSDHFFLLNVFYLFFHMSTSAKKLCIFLSIFFI